MGHISEMGSKFAVGLLVTASLAGCSEQEYIPQPNDLVDCRNSKESGTGKYYLLPNESVRINHLTLTGQTDGILINGNPTSFDSPTSISSNNILWDLNSKPTTTNGAPVTQVKVTATCK